MRGDSELRLAPSELGSKHADTLYSAGKASRVVIKGVQPVLQEKGRTMHPLRVAFRGPSRLRTCTAFLVR